MSTSARLCLVVCLTVWATSGVVGQGVFPAIGVTGAAENRTDASVEDHTNKPEPEEDIKSSNADSVEGATSAGANDVTVGNEARDATTASENQVVTESNAAVTMAAESVGVVKLTTAIADNAVEQQTTNVADADNPQQTTGYDEPVTKRLSLGPGTDKDVIFLTTEGPPVTEAEQKVTTKVPSAVTTPSETVEESQTTAADHKGQATTVEVAIDVGESTVVSKSTTGVAVAEDVTTVAAEIASTSHVVVADEVTTTTSHVVVEDEVSTNPTSHRVGDEITTTAAEIASTPQDVIADEVTTIAAEIASTSHVVVGDEVTTIAAEIASTPHVVIADEVTTRAAEIASTSHTVVVDEVTTNAAATTDDSTILGTTHVEVAVASSSDAAATTDDSISIVNTTSDVGGVDHDGLSTVRFEATTEGKLGTTEQDTVIETTTLVVDIEGTGTVGKTDNDVTSGIDNVTINEVDSTTSVIEVTEKKIDDVTIDSNNVTAMEADSTTPVVDITEKRIDDVTTESGNITINEVDSTTPVIDVTERSDDVTTGTGNVTINDVDNTTFVIDVTEGTNDVTTVSDNVTSNEVESTTSVIDVTERTTNLSVEDIEASTLLSATTSQENLTTEAVKLPGSTEVTETETETTTMAQESVNTTSSFSKSDNVTADFSSAGHSTTQGLPDQTSVPPVQSVSDSIDITNATIGDAITTMSPPSEQTSASDETTTAAPPGEIQSTSAESDDVTDVDTTPSEYGVSSSSRTSATDKPTSVAPTQPQVRDSKYRIVFKGDCKKFSDDDMNTFKEALKQKVASYLEMDTKRCQITDVKCGSIIVEVLITDTKDEDIDEKMQNALESNFTVELEIGNKTLSFPATEIEPIYCPDCPTSKPIQPDDDDDDDGLSNVEIIIIIICSVVGGTLLLFAFIYCCYSCCCKGKSKSFDLGYTPDYALHKGEDFTLTKLDRPQPVYDDRGPVMHTDIDIEEAATLPKRTHQARAYPPSDSEINGTGGFSTFKDSPSPNRANGSAPPHEKTTSSENLVPQQQEDSPEAPSAGLGSPASRGGYDNPSFSSDDILDSGPDTDSELPHDETHLISKPDIGIQETRLQQEDADIVIPPPTSFLVENELEPETEKLTTKTQDSPGRSSGKDSESSSTESSKAHQDALVDESATAF